MDKYTLFESYISKNLSQNESSDFEQRLQNEPQLKADFDAHIKTHAALDILVEDDILKVIEDIDNDTAAVSKGNKFKWKIMAIAASLAGLLVVSMFLFQDSVPKEEQLFAEYYKVPLTSKTTRNAVASNKQEARVIGLSRKAHDLLAIKEYKKANEIFQTLIIETEDQDREKNQWYFILSQMCYDKDTALSLLNSLTSNRDHYNYEDLIKLQADLKQLSQ